MLTERLRNLRRFAHDERGAVAVIVAMMLTVLMGFVALGVDVASIYRDTDRVQGMSDLAAMSAMADVANADERAAHAVSVNGRRQETLVSVEQGRFLRNPAVPREDRFQPLTPGSAGINAVRTVVSDNAPLHFARVFANGETVAIHRSGMAIRTGAASFSLGSHLVGLDGAALNSALTDAFGASAQIAMGDMAILAEATINLGDLMQALGGSETANPAEILDQTVTVTALIGAVQDLLPSGLGSALQGLASAGQGRTVDVSAVVGGIDTALGLTVTEFLTDIDLSVLDIIKAIVQAEPSQASLDLAGGVPGFLDVNAGVSAGGPPAQSGWMALGEEGVTLHRAAARVDIDAELEPQLLSGLGVGIEALSLHLPVTTELAGATATLDHLSCADQDPDAVAASVLVSSTPLHPANGSAIATLILGSVAFETGNAIAPGDVDFADILSVRITIPVPLLPDIVLSDLVVQARSHVSLGQSAVERVDYSFAEVGAGDTKRTFGSAQVLGTAVGQLLSPEHLEIRVKPGQAGLVTGLVAPIVEGLLQSLPGALLSAVTTPLDAVLDTTLASLGVTVGAGELNLTGHHCERVRLVQ
ncbi:TadG family pilus assembly protein [Shimia ponticola]|uniref:TadG family pilus assembly protein n=1 Tax=Shimia ponticola TaxID=2582893 RepID=UPI0011BD90C0|nr:pilus assembly protein TadG-related protein [Shimia ponticola]